MKQAFIKLHISIVLAGFTGIFGKIIMLNEGLLVCYRMLITALVMLAILLLRTHAHTSFPNLLRRGKTGGRLLGVGCLLALHWVFFFGSIKSSNVSIGVICFSLTGFFTAFLEPLMNKRKISFKELSFSLVTLLGILFIFHFDMRYRTGILLGIVSSLFAALFTITNKQVATGCPSGVMLLYEMTGGFLLLVLLMPFYLYFFPVATILPDKMDWIYLLLFSVFCTVLLYLLQIDVLKSISAFTVNLSYNLEPVYSILIAMLFLGEAKELNFSFYIGLGLIVFSVFLQTWSVWKSKKRVSYL
ncbi:MAG: DMT family transporter [Tannerellaceae bacterium]|jgi:drug/metabolite transporter (DMT)-like permease|nr:DMT family transporter [Tannerellaceae bacterium]